MSKADGRGVSTAKQGQGAHSSRGSEGAQTCPDPMALGLASALRRVRRWKVSSAGVRAEKGQGLPNGRPELGARGCVVLRALTQPHRF